MTDLSPANTNKPFTLRVFFPDGNPNGIRLIDDNNWTGRAICLSRDDLESKDLLEKIELVQQPGVYLLIGDVDDNAENPDNGIQLYIGETDNVAARLTQHADTKTGKDNWNRSVVFISIKGALNKAHCLWLERKLILRAKEYQRCVLGNANRGNDASLTFSEEADCDFYLDKMLQILPFAGVNAFEKIDNSAINISAQPKAVDTGAPDTIVVPARDGGFERVFLGEDCWHAIRIHKSRFNDLKYIAAYRVGKERKVTHVAEIKNIEPVGDDGKYKVIFNEKAKKLTHPVPYISGSDSTLQASRYTRFEKLNKAQNLTELFDLSDV